MMKTCKTCKTEKPLSDYYKNKQGYHFGACKKCHIEKVRRNQNKNPDQYKEYCKEYKRSPENKERVKNQIKLWWISEKGKAFERRRNQSEERKEFYRRRSKERWNRDPEYYRLKRRARQLNCSIETIGEIFQRDGKCQLCGCSENLQLDHIFPESLGGQGIKQNLQLLCGPCNLFKSNNLLLPDRGGIMILSKDLKLRLVEAAYEAAPATQVFMTWVA